MAKKTPHVIENILQKWDYETDSLIEEFDISKTSEWDYWQKFLEDHHAFRYVWTNHQGFNFSFSARKVMRPMYGGAPQPVWYAYKQIGGKRRHLYLGKNENLTAEKLQDTALEINQTQLSVEKKIHQ